MNGVRPAESRRYRNIRDGNCRVRSQIDFDETPPVPMGLCHGSGKVLLGYLSRSVLPGKSGYNLYQTED